MATDVAKIPRFRDSSYGFQIPMSAMWKGRLPENCKNGKIPFDVKDWKCPSGMPGVKGFQPARFEWKRYWVDLKDWVAFLGIYTAEGSASGVMGWNKFFENSSIKKTAAVVDKMAASAEMNHQYGANLSCPKNVSISQSKNGRHYPKIKELLERLPFEFSEDSSGFVCRDKGFHELMFPLGNKYGKRIPEWVKELPKDCLQVFIDWYVMGDGYKREGSKLQDYSSTCSKLLADDLQEVFVKLGTSASITIIPPCETEIHGKRYERATHYRVQQRKR